MNATMIRLDGSQGEGGGQILRSALSLSMITGKPFVISHIRAGRKKPGLMRQHLTAVEAAAAVCKAEVSGAELGSPTLSFAPASIRSGEYNFAIGSAGSASLVLQTILPALWHADSASTVTVSGGTHNSMAPPVDFLQRSWLPQLKNIGVDADIKLLRHGFYPAGGGVVQCGVTPVSQWGSLHLIDRGALLSIHAEIRVAGLAEGIAKREAELLRESIACTDIKIAELPGREGPGNVIIVDVTHEYMKTVFTAFGEKSKPVEQVVQELVKQINQYMHSPAAVDEHLSDQLLLPMALAAQGRFTVAGVSQHLLTNISVIEAFLPVRFSVQAIGDVCVEVSIVE